MASLATSSVTSVVTSVVEEIEGDLLDCPNATHVVHQTNCVTRSAKGLAKHLFAKFPNSNTYKSNDPLRIPGTCSLHPQLIDPSLTVVNLYGQYGPGKKWDKRRGGPRDDRQARTSYFQMGLEDLGRILQQKTKTLPPHSPTPHSLPHSSVSAAAVVAFPFQIGCNLAGGDWTTYRQMIEEFAVRHHAFGVRVLIVRLPLQRDIDFHQETSGTKRKKRKKKTKTSGGGGGESGESGGGGGESGGGGSASSSTTPSTAGETKVNSASSTSSSSSSSSSSTSTTTATTATTTTTIKVVLLRAKYNHKYKKRKKLKPRINQDDLNVLHLMVQHTNVTFDYNPTTNDLIFDTHAAPSDEWQQDIVVDGEDTGGQIVRTCLQLAVQISGGRQTPGGAPPLLEIPSKDKACMLYVQASMYTLEIGGSFMIHGGSSLNPDAPTPENYHHIFAMLKKFLGISFRLDDASSTSSSTTTSTTLSPSKFVLTREADVQPTVNPSDFVSEIPLTYMMMDQLLMGLSLRRQLPAAEGKIIQLVCDYNKDYHVNAMVKMLRLLHHDVVDKRVGGLRKICIQL